MTDHEFRDEILEAIIRKDELKKTLTTLEALHQDSRTLEDAIDHFKVILIQRYGYDS